MTKEESIKEDYFRINKSIDYFEDKLKFQNNRHIERILNNLWAHNHNS
ncbi:MULTISPECIES: hypothetical protein [Flavobacterium]|uniref:Uncharacterized protein n=1 Tax=Flavobacterium chungangensis TaxID=2708132 RepID=A0ABV8ZD22_9FLAO|nr:hypothetical protein [Flavobacterium sp. ACN2]